ncbi:MAG: ArnT family glycosyltransferase [Anaerolineae bacterium]
MNGSMPALHVPEPREIVQMGGHLVERLRRYWRQPEHQMLWIIIALAAVLRLVALDLIEFRPEQVAQLVEAERIGRLQLPVLGPHTLAAPDTPSLSSYLLALPVQVQRDPRVAAVLISLIHTISIGWCFTLARRYYGVRVAVIAATLYAITPWAVIFSRRITGDALLPLLNIWLLQNLAVVLIDRRPQAWVGIGLALALMSYTSAAFYALAAVSLVLAILYRRRARLDYAVIGLLVGAAVWLPWLAYQIATGSPTFSLIGETLRDMASSGMRRRAFLYGAWIHSGYSLAGLAAPSVHEYHLLTQIYDRFTQLMGGLFMLSLPATVAMAVYAWSRWRERIDTASYAILAVWLWLPWLLLPGAPERLEPQSLMVLYPAGFIAMGLLIDRVLAWLDAVWSQHPRRLNAVHLAIWAVLWCHVALSAHATLTLYHMVDSRDTSQGYGIPYRYWRRAAGMVQREARNNGADQIWMLQNDPHPMAVLRYLLEPPFRVLDIASDHPETLPLPVERSALYLRAEEPVQSRAAKEWVGAKTTGITYFPGETLHIVAQVSDAYHAQEILSAVPEPGIWMLDAGVWLLGYEWPAEILPGQEVHLTTYWTFLDVPPGERDVEHELVIDLIGPGGDRFAQATGFGLPESHWIEGLVVQQWHTLQIPDDAPEGRYTLLIGMYRLTDGLWSRQIDDEGFDLGSAIEIGPLRVGRSLAWPAP